MTTQAPFLTLIFSTTSQVISTDTSVPPLQFFSGTEPRYASFLSIQCRHLRTTHEYDETKTENAALPPVAVVHVVRVVDVDCMAIRLDGGEKVLGLEVLVALSECVRHTEMARVFPQTCIWLLTAVESAVQQLCYHMYACKYTW